MAPLPAGRGVAPAAGPGVARASRCRARSRSASTRRWSSCSSSATEALHPSLSKLGPDLLADPVDVDEAMRRLRDPSRDDLTIARGAARPAGDGRHRQRGQEPGPVGGEASRRGPGSATSTTRRSAGSIERPRAVLREGAATGRRPRERPRPGRAPVPALRDDHAGEGAGPGAAAPDLLVPGVPARSGEPGMSDDDRRPLRAHRRRLDMLRDGRRGDGPETHHAVTSDAGRPRPPRPGRRAIPTTSSAARSRSCSRASRRNRSSRPSTCR